MTLAEMWPTLQKLPRAEKLRLVQSLMVELERGEDATLVEPGASYPIWTPLGADEAAATMLRLLQESKS